MGVVIDSYSGPSDSFNRISSVYFSGIVGQSFTGNGELLDIAIFEIFKEGSPTGNVYAKLYSHTGTFGISSFPGSLLATSDPIDASNFSTTPSLMRFFFSTPYTVNNGTHYVIAIEYTGGDGTNNLAVRIDISDPTHSGNAFRDSVSLSSYDHVFYVETIVGAEIRAVGTPATGSGATITPTIPSTAIAGDKLLALVYTKTNNQTFTCSAGWDENYDPGSQTNGSFAVYSRTFVGGDGNPTITPIVPPSTANADSVIAVIISIFNWNTTTLLDVAIAGAAFTAASSIEIPTFDTATDGALAFMLWGSVDDNTWDYDETDGGSQLVSQNETSGSDAAMCVACKYMPTAGAVGAQSATQTTKASDAGRYLYFAIKAAAAAGPANIKTVDGTAKASIKTVLGTAIGSIKTINGVAYSPPEEIEYDLAAA